MPEEKLLEAHCIWNTDPSEQDIECCKKDKNWNALR